MGQDSELFLAFKANRQPHRLHLLTVKLLLKCSQEPQILIRLK